MLSPNYRSLEFSLDELIIHATDDQDPNDDEDVDVAVVGFWSGFVWLFVVTIITAWLSEYVVGTIEVSIITTILFNVLLNKECTLLTCTEIRIPNYIRMHRNLGVCL